MAVARIKATRAWHLKTANRVRDVPRLARELERAAERHGLRAELHADEMRILANRLPKDKLVIQALAELEAAEAYDASRPRARDIALGLVRKEKDANRSNRT